MKVHKGDTVLVIAGKDKGAKGKVLQAYPDRNRVLVEGVNRIKKHTKVGQTQRGAKTGMRFCRCHAIRGDCFRSMRRAGLRPPAALIHK